MTVLIIKHSIALLYLLAGSVSDIKTREVPDWANYGLITVAMGSNLIFSLASNDWSFIINSLLGFGAFLILALIMFYAGQWGGGDSKMLMGLGALYGLGFNWNDSSFLASFLINSLIAGAVYGLGWSIVAAIRNRKKFVTEYSKLVSKKSIRKTRKVLIVMLVISILLFIFLQDILSRLMFLSLALAIFSTFYMWLFIKTVENSSMYKYVTPDKLTEGDWIAKEIKYKGKVITGPKDLGIEKKQINKLKRLFKLNKIRKVLIKEGIPFVPSFLAGWIITVVWGNVLGMII